MKTQEKQIIEIAKELNRILTDGIEIHPNSPIHEKLNRALRQPAVSNSVCEICGKPVHPSYNLCFEHLVCNVPKPPKQTDC